MVEVLASAVRQLKGKNGIEIERKKQNRKAYARFKKNCDKETKILHLKLASSIVSTHSTFSIVENEEFEDFVHWLNPKYIIPSADTFLKTIIPNIVSKIKF